MAANIEETLFREFGCQFKAGSSIFQEGDPGDLVYIILTGEVQVSKTVRDKSRILATLSRGDFFGEMALISDKPRSATVTVMKDCRMLALGRKIFFRILRSNYEVTVRLVEQLASRLAEADRQLENLMFADTTARLVKVLEETSKTEIFMKTEDLAYELGVFEERLSRILRKFEEKGIMEVTPGSMVIRDREKLAKLKDYLFLKEEFGQID